MKCQDLFSLKKKKKLECRLLQMLLGTLRFKALSKTVADDILNFLHDFFFQRK